MDGTASIPFEIKISRSTLSKKFIFAQCKQIRNVRAIGLEFFADMPPVMKFVSVKVDNL